MGAITDLFKSERGLLTVAIIAAATVLCGTHQLTVDQWTEFVKWVFGFYVAGKTVTGAVAAYTAPDPAAGTRMDALMELAKQYMTHAHKDSPDANGTARTQDSPGAAGTQGSTATPEHPKPPTSTTPTSTTQGATP